MSSGACLSPFRRGEHLAEFEAQVREKVLNERDQIVQEMFDVLGEIEDAEQ